MESQARTQRIAPWVASLLIVIGVGGAGITKFTQSEMWNAEFAAWGYPVGLVPVVGVLEIVGSVAILWPRIAFYGAGVTTGVMTVAALTRIVHAEWGPVVAALVLGALAAYVSWTRRPEWIERVMPRGNRPS